MPSQIFYRGAYPTVPLVDGQHGGFRVDVRVFFSAAVRTQGALVVQGSWRGASAQAHLVLPAGESNATVSLTAEARDVDLWWPHGLGRQPLYNLSVRYTASAGGSAVHTQRVVGFRYAALVTGNDTDPAYVAAAATSEGSSGHGMYLRVNGAVLFSRGANVIPMEELEGRLTDAAHAAMVASAAAGAFNMLRVWGGGMFLPDAFYNACDRMGLLVYHDMMYAQNGHAPLASAAEESELRHTIRRLSSHASIVVWDGCNECQVVMGSPTAVYASFVMSTVAQEDASRAVWPSCPAVGWATGVRQLDSLPNGRPLTTPRHGPRIETHGPYQHGSGFPAVNGDAVERPFPANIPITVADEPTGPAVANVFASEFGSVSMSSFESMAPTLAPEHWALHAGQPSDTCNGRFANQCDGSNVMAERNYPCDNLINVYFGPRPGSYFNTTGEGPFKRQLYQCMLSAALEVKADVETRRSRNELGILIWQFNVSPPPPTLAPASPPIIHVTLTSWSSLPMAQEIWPTGGWGSIEYGAARPGQVLGGRWKPLHYLYARSIFADVMASCGAGGVCFVKNDAAGAAFVGQVEISSLEFATGTRRVLHTLTARLAEGAGISERFEVDMDAVGNTTHMLVATCYRLCGPRRCTPTELEASGAGRVGGIRRNSESGGTSLGGGAISLNEILLAPPKSLALPAAKVAATVAAAPAADGSIGIALDANATALYVTLTTLAHGRFSDNAFAMSPGRSSVRFLPIGALDLPLLVKSLRVEHLQEHL